MNAISIADLYELFLERAAIIEFDAGLTRYQATCNAAREIKRIYKLDKLPQDIIDECERVKK